MPRLPEAATRESPPTEWWVEACDPEPRSYTPGREGGQKARASLSSVPFLPSSGCGLCVQLAEVTFFQNVGFSSPSHFHFLGFASSLFFFLKEKSQRPVPVSQAHTESLLLWVVRGVGVGRGLLGCQGGRDRISAPRGQASTWSPTCSPLQFLGQGSDPRRYGAPCSGAVSMSPRALAALATGPIPIRRLEGLCPHPPPDNVIQLPEV